MVLANIPFIFDDDLYVWVNKCVLDVCMKKVHGLFSRVSENVSGVDYWYFGSLYQ